MVYTRPIRNGPPISETHMEFRTEPYESIQFAPALAMAMMESTGIRRLLDEEAKNIDGSLRNLSTGMAAKAMIGTMFTEGIRKPLYRIGDQYSTAPVDKLFGNFVGHRTLSDTNLSSRLDVLFKMDTEEILWRIHRILCDMLGLSTDLYRFDSTNFPFYGVSYEDRSEGAIPKYSRTSKNKRYDLLQKNVQAICDGNGLLVSSRCYDGNVSDISMDMDSLDFLAKHIDCSRSYVCADCKLATSGLISKMMDMDLGFVTRCPLNFADRIHDDIVRSVMMGRMDESKGHEGRYVYDTHSEVELDGRIMDLRFVAYRLPKSYSDAVRFYRTKALSAMESRLVSLKRELFHCDKDAREAFDIVMGTDKEGIFSADVEVFMDGRKHKEDPDGPCWRAYFKDLRIDEDALDRAAREYSVNVLITNIPSANESHVNPRFGSTADDIVDIYLGEFDIEHVFRLGKSGLGMDRMFLHTPSRQDAVVFLTSIATMISKAMDIVLKRNTPKGRRALTMKYICDRKAGTVLRYDRDSDSVTILGEPGDREFIFDILDQLDIEPDLLLGY